MPDLLVYDVSVRASLPNGGRMKASNKITCFSCGRRIPRSEPDLIVTDFETGKSVPTTNAVPPQRLPGLHRTQVSTT